MRIDGIARSKGEKQLSQGDRARARARARVMARIRVMDRVRMMVNYRSI